MAKQPFHSNVREGDHCSSLTLALIVAYEQHYSVFLQITYVSKHYLKKDMTSYLSSIDVLHYKAQAILSLERVLQRLQHNALRFFFETNTQNKSFVVRI